MAALACAFVLLFGLVVPQGTPFGVQQAPSRDTSALPKGTASLRGKVVTADTGRPIRRAQVSLSGAEGGEPRTVSTNALGIFEAVDLPAGRYTVTVTKSGYLRLQYGQRRPGEPGRPVELADGQKMTNLDLSLPKASAITGRVTDELGDPMPNASIFPMQWRYFRGERRLVPVSGGGPFNRSDDTGQFRITGLEPGDYVVMAVTRESWTDEKNPKERIGFLPTYSGSTATPADAARVRVVLGQDAPIPDIAMVPGRVGTISGTALSSAGVPLAGEQLNLMQEFQGPGSSSSFGAPGTKVSADGSFTIRNVVPGTYKVSLRTAADPERPVEFAATTIHFLGDDLTGLQIVTAPGATLRGRVVTESGEALARDLKVTVAARPLDPSRNAPLIGQDNGRMKEDGTFEIAGVQGAVRITVSGIPSGWYLRSVMHDGKDIVDTPLDVRGGALVDGLSVLLTKTLPEVRGTLLDAKGQVPDGSVILFPEDAAQWAEESRLIKRVRPDATGAFAVRQVIPGNYLAAAVEYVRDGEFQDPAFLEGLREHARRVRVDEGGTPPPVSLTIRK
jgi:hypothetical protein